MQPLYHAPGAFFPFCYFYQIAALSYNEINGACILSNE